MPKLYLHPATAVLTSRGVRALDVASAAGYQAPTVYAQLEGRLSLTRRTFDAIAELESLSVALQVAAALGVDPRTLPAGRSRGAHRKASEDTERAAPEGTARP